MTTILINKGNMVLMEQQYKEIRRKLDELGYNQPCSSESILLVDRLLTDLTRAKREVVDYEDIANKELEKYQQLEGTLEHFKKENKRLIKDNNELHLDNIQAKDESEKLIKELKMRINELENIYSDVEFNYMEQMSNMNALRQELLEKNNKLYELGIPDEKNYEVKDNVSYYQDLSGVRYTPDVYDEIENYKRRQRQLLDENELLQEKLNSRNCEIARLRNQLEKGCEHYTKNIEKICCCHTTNTDIIQHSNEMKKQIKTAQDKQHEAMQRAIILAEKVEILQGQLAELRKENKSDTNITFLQKRYTETLNKMKDMELRIAKLQTVTNNLSKEKTKNEDKISNFEKERDALHSKFNNIKLIENDLNLEIDRLTRCNSELKDEIARLTEKNTTLERTLKESKSIPQTGRQSRQDVTQASTIFDDSICEKIKAERDYYCNELHRLQEKVYNADRIHSLRCCNHSESGADIALIKKLQSDVYMAKDENVLLHNEISSLKKCITEYTSFKHDCNSKLIANQIKQLQNDNVVLTSTNKNLEGRLHNSERNVQEQSKRIEQVKEELDNYRAKYNHLKKVNLHLEMSTKNKEAATLRAEQDLIQSMGRINELEKHLKCAKEEIMLMKKAKQEARENLLKLDQEKDELLLKVDEKTIVISKLDKDLQLKHAQNVQIENKKCKLQKQLEAVERTLQLAEDKSREYLKDKRRLEQDNISLQSYKDNLLFENETLKRELAALGQDTLLRNDAIEKAQKESDDLKRQLQTYVDEVRRVENILLEKEKERELLLEQFNVLSAEASHLESNQQSLECEANLTKGNLKDIQEKYSILQKDHTAKDSLVSNMELQIGQLSDQIVQLESKLVEMSDRELMLTSDLSAARSLCSTLQEQKRYCDKQMEQTRCNEQPLRDELERLECENITLHNQLSQEKRSSHVLENILTSTRHDAMEKSVYNDDLSKEVRIMKETVEALETKLNSVKRALSECQSTCADYHSENMQLKRQITNERFEKAKDMETSNSTSL